MRLNSVKAVTDAALIPRDPTPGEQFSRSMTLRSKRPAIPTEQRWVSLPANDRTFFAPPRLRHEFGLDRPYQQHSWTYAVIRALAGPISQIPLVVKCGDRANPQTVLPGMLGYEFQELFDHPHIQLTSTELKESHVDHLSLAGECLGIKVGADPDVPIGPYEIPKELYPFSGREFDHVMDPSRRRIIGYLHRQPGKRDADAYLAHEICATRYYNPYYPLRGLAPHEAARQPTQSDWKQMQYNEAYLDNDASPGVVIVSQTELSRSQADELRESWDERNRGYRRRRRTTVLEGGLDIRNLGTTHVDMDFVNLARYNVEQLCAVYKVPDAEINNYKSLNFATAEAIKTQYWNNTLIPIMNLIEDAWYQQIMALPGRGRFWVEFDRSKIDALVENELTKLETAKVAMDMGVPFNEVNERYQLGMKKQEGWGDLGSFPMPRTPAHSLLQPIAPQGADPFEKPGQGDGGEFPNPNHPGKLPHIPGTPRPPAGGGGKPSSGGPGESPGGVSGGQGNPDQPTSIGPNVIGAEPEITDSAEPEEERLDEVQDPERAVTAVEAEVLDEMALPLAEADPKLVDTTALELNVWLETRDAGKTARWEQHLRFLRPREKAFHKRYGNYLHQLRKHQLARLDALHEDKIAAWAENLGTAWRSGDVQKLTQTRKEIDDLLFDLALWNQKLVSMTHGIYISISDDAVNEALKEMGVPEEAGHAAEIRTKLLEAVHDREKILVKTNDTLRADLYKEMERSIELGETLTQMALRIKQVFNLSNGQAMRIARTETGGMASAAKYAAHQAEGLEKHEWLTARDERVRHTHRAQDGVVVNVGEKFPNGLKYPLDPEGSQDETINCFPAGTRVLTADGEIPIEEVRSGDLVLTHRGRWKSVIERHISVEGRQLVEIVLDSGRTFRITPAHKLFVVGKGWVEAGSLESGDELVEPGTLAAVHEAIGEIEHPHPELLENEMAMGAQELLPSIDLYADREVRKKDVDVVIDHPSELSTLPGSANGVGPVTALNSGPKASVAQPLPGDDLSWGAFSPVGVFLGMSESERGVDALKSTPLGIVDPLRGDGLAAMPDRDSEVDHYAAKHSDLREPKLGHEVPVAGKFGHVAAPEKDLEWFANPSAQPRNAVVTLLPVLASARTKASRTDLARMAGEKRPAALATNGSGHTRNFTQVVAVRQVGGLHQVFNLGVDEDMSYFAAGVLGRNCRCTTMPVLSRGWIPLSMRSLTKVPDKETKA